MSDKLEAREFRNPAGRWYLTLATANEANPAEQFLSEDQAKGIAHALSQPIPVTASVEGSNLPRVEDTIWRRMKAIPWPGTPLATAEELRLAHAIVDSDPVLRVFAAVEWDCLDRNGKEWIAVIIREARHLPAQPVPNDVAALVVAAREVLEEYGTESVDEQQAGHDTLRQLDKAAEAFASRVCWDDDGGSLKEAHAVPCTCGLSGKR